MALINKSAESSAVPGAPAVPLLLHTLTLIVELALANLATPKPRKVPFNWSPLTGAVYTSAFAKSPYLLCPAK